MIAAAMARPRILVIKLSALGDFVLAMGPAAAIRAHHPEAEITLLTTAPLRELALAAPYFDRIEIDTRPRWRDLAGWLRLRRWLIAQHFDRVYDLQTSDRSSFYFYLMGPGRRPEWSGIARGASHPDSNPKRETTHTIERQAEQLRLAGIEAVPPPDISWAARDIDHFDLPQRFLLLAPGGAPHRPQKRWPVENFAALARIAVARGMTPLILGHRAEQETARTIARAVPGARDLTMRTGIGELVALGQRAVRAIGNDTGPMHVLAIAGTPVTVLYSAASDPSLSAPRGQRVTILHKPDLAQLGVDEVAATLTP